MTINALFYNVHTRKVEDFTERVICLVSTIIIATTKHNSGTG